MESNLYAVSAESAEERASLLLESPLGVPRSQRQRCCGA